MALRMGTLVERLVLRAAYEDGVLTPTFSWRSITLGFILMFGLMVSVKFAKKLDAT